MIDVEDLIALIYNYNPRCDADKIRKAYSYGMAMHEGQLRKSGEPYFSHPVAVAAILTEQRLDDDTIITALLHDTIEDTRSTYNNIAELFGKEIAELVDGVTKLTNLQLTNTESKQAENFRKLFLAMSKDLRVILIKLADRLHNMRTIQSMTREKQVQKARETMEIYAPLAGRMGMQWMREELEDLSFKILNRKARKSIIRRFLVLQRKTDKIIPDITNDITRELGQAKIEATVYGRAKKPYSVWRKMQEKDLSFSQLSDIYGFRVICGSIADCYRILGIIHQRWRAVPGRFKDYISLPKSNGYRSIHTTVIHTTVSGHDGKRVEIQIRTHEMHEIAESGVAAHWAYREGDNRSPNPFAVDPVKWLNGLTESFDYGDHGEFIKHVKLEMYLDQVFCFTPKGDVIQLPRGATPLDFAYAIHTKIGNATVSAQINGKRVPLWTRLRNGHCVEILTAEGQFPQASWIDIVKTGRAKAAIRKALRDEERKYSIQLGQEFARAAFAHIDKKPTDKALKTAADILGYQSDEDLLEHLGVGNIAAHQVVNALYPELTSGDLVEVDIPHPIIGPHKDQNFTRATCCQPLPGERIIGIKESTHDIVAHAIDCPVLAETEKGSAQWVDLSWQSGRHPAVHTVTFFLTITNERGVLGRICTLVGEQMANISNLSFTERKPEFYRLTLDIDLCDLKHLYKVLFSLEAETDIAQISRKRAT